MRKTTKTDLLNIVAQTLFDKKAFNIIAFDLHNVSTVTDYSLIAEGTVERHVLALADEIQKQLKKKGETPYRIEGDKTGDWVVLDYVDFVIHLFVPETREKYDLEQLWRKAEVVDLKIVVSPKESAV